MYEQHRIPSTLSDPETLARVKALMAAAGSASRMEISRRDCVLFGFLDASGRPQLASCMQALRTLDAAGHIRLPAPRHNHRRCRPRCIGRPVPPPVGVPARADQLHGLELVEVTDPAQRGIWNELMRSEHPRAGSPRLRRSGSHAGRSRHLHRLGRRPALPPAAPGDRTEPFPDSLFRPLPQPGFEGPRPGLAPPARRLPAPLRLPSAARGNLCRERPLPRHLAGSRQLAAAENLVADVFALFAEQRRLRKVDLLVRAKHNRSLGADGPKLFDWVRAEPAQGRLQMHVARLSARRASQGQKGSAAREEREEQVELRWREVELADPDRQEAALAVQTQQEAERVLEWYKLRWRIEDWHRVLKSGCKVEYLGHRQGERIERAVTINAVIAWRLTLMTLLGRDTPELPADTLFTEIELAALEDFAQDRRQLPPDNLGRAVLTLAMLGGYLNYKRKQYAVPGHKVMWEGYTRLATITQVVERTRRLNEGSKLYQKMRRE